MSVPKTSDDIFLPHASSHDRHACVRRSCMCCMRYTAAFFCFFLLSRSSHKRRAVLLLDVLVVVSRSNLVGGMQALPPEQSQAPPPSQASPQPQAPPRPPVQNGTQAVSSPTPTPTPPPKTAVPNPPAPAAAAAPVAAPAAAAATAGATPMADLFTFADMVSGAFRSQELSAAAAAGGLSSGDLQNWIMQA